MVEGSAEQAFKTVLPEMQTVVGNVLAGMTGGSVGVVLHIAMQLLRDDTTQQEYIANTFGNLVDLTPPEMEMIERQEGLEPLTLQGFHEILDRDANNWNKIRQKVRENEQILEEFRKFLSISPEEWMIFDEQRLRGINETLASESELTPIFQILLSDIVNTPEEALKDERNEEIKELSLDHTVLNSGREWEEISAESVKQCYQTITNKKVDTLRVEGPPGIGKTTLVHQVAKELEDAGYLVGVPNLNSEHVETFLEQVDKEVVLIHEFSLIENNRDVNLRRLLTMTQRGLCDGVILTFTSAAKNRLELHSLFEDYFSLGEVWDHAEKIEMGGVDYLSFADIIRSNFDTNISEQEIQSIFKFSMSRAGRTPLANPLFGMVATNHWIKVSEDYQSIDQALKAAGDPQRILCMKAVGHIFEEYPNGEPKYPVLKQILLYTAAAGRIFDKELEKLLKKKKIKYSESLDEKIQRIDIIKPVYFDYSLPSIVSTDEQDTVFTIRPEAVQQAIFDTKCMDELDDIISSFADSSLISDLGIMLGSRLTVMQRQSATTVRGLTVEDYCSRIEQVLDAPDSDLYYGHCLYFITDTGARLPPTLIDSERIVTELPSQIICLILARNAAAWATIGDYQKVEEHVEIAISVAKNHTYNVKRCQLWDDRMYRFDQSWEDHEGIENWGWVGEIDSDAHLERIANISLGLRQYEAFLVDFHSCIVQTLAYHQGRATAKQHFGQLEESTKQTASQEVGYFVQPDAREQTRTEEVGASDRRFRFMNEFYQRILLPEEVAASGAVVRTLEEIYTDRVRDILESDPDDTTRIPGYPMFEVCSEVISESFQRPVLMHEFFLRLFDRTNRLLIQRYLHGDLPEQHSLSWRAIHLPLNDAANNLDIPKKRWFLVRYYANCMSTLFGNLSTVEPTQLFEFAQRWEEIFNDVVDSAQATAETHARYGSAAEIMREFYVLSVQLSMERHPPQAVTPWFRLIDVSATTYAKQKKDDISSYTFKLRFAAEVATRVIENYEVSPGKVLFGTIEQHFRQVIPQLDGKPATVTDDRVEPALLSFYARTLSSVATSNNVPFYIAEPWVEFIHNRAEKLYNDVNSSETDYHSHIAVNTATSIEWLNWLYKKEDSFLHALSEFETEKELRDLMVSHSMALICNVAKRDRRD